MRHLRIAVLSLVSAILSGCGFAHDERLTGDYRLIAVDSVEEMSVCRRLPDGNAIGRIGETVFAVGWNDQYIVAKQHPAKNRNVTNYYFLDISRDSTYADPSQSVTGPLTEAVFNQRKAELKLPDFRRTIKQLE
jgi:hypothetical protein